MTTSVTARAATALSTRTRPVKAPQPFTLRQPQREDASDIHGMMRRYRPYVGNNPPYTYLLVTEHHAETSVVATTEEGKLAGLVSAYWVPERPETLFIWEVAVNEQYRGNRLALTMLEHLYQRLHPRFVEATINPSNDASRRQFELLAERHGCTLERDVLFTSEDFGDVPHEEEVLFRVGPFSADRSAT